jgi:hypothetical protein
MNKERWLYLLLFIGICYGLFFLFDRGNRLSDKVSSIVRADSIRVKILNDKILKLDSIDNALKVTDSLLDKRIIINKSKYQKSRGKYEASKNNIPAMPDLGK